MSTPTIRNVDPTIKERLRVCAARNGRSMEAELRHILNDAAGRERDRELGLADAIHRRFLPFGGVEDLATHPAASVGESFGFDPRNPG